MSIKNKLNRLKPHLNHTKEKKEIVTLPQRNIKEVSLYGNLERSRSKYRITLMMIIVLSEKLPTHLNTYHGKYRFRDFLSAIEAWNKSS